MKIVLAIMVLIAGAIIYKVVTNKKDNAVGYQGGSTGGGNTGGGSTGGGNTGGGSTGGDEEISEDLGDGLGNFLEHEKGHKGSKGSGGGSLTDIPHLEDGGNQDENIRVRRDDIEMQ
jgi:hypothetical protein